MTFVLKTAGLTHVGMRRTQNQDSIFVDDGLRLYIVADGMGGHKGGEIASSLAVETISNYFRALSIEKSVPKNHFLKFSQTARSQPKFSAPEKVQTAILTANEAIQTQGARQAQLQGMGTTTTALLFEDNAVTIGHVGDSRCYLLDNNEIWQLTQDHSLVQEKLRAGLITRDQLKTDKLKNVITRSVGFDSNLEVDVYQYQPKPGNVFIICSDGLSGMVPDERLQNTVCTMLKEARSPREIAENLIALANQNGGEDNVSAIVVEVQEKNN